MRGILTESFLAAARKIAAMGLVRCSSGNLSCRAGEGQMLIKSSRAWLGELTKDGISLCRIADGAALKGTPSVETGFHAGVLRERPNVNVVLHFQSPSATTVACYRSLKDVNFSVIPEIPFYIGPIAVVPYLPPGSGELAEAVVAAMKDHDLAILGNHGQVTVGKDFDDAIQKAAFFELACGIIVRGRSRVGPLPGEAVEDLRAKARAPKPGPA